MLGVMPMQWYVSLVTIAAAGVLGWIVLELLGKPIRTFFDLRDQIRAQLLLLANVAPLKPRETISTSLEIRQYDVALKAGREAQRIFRHLGSQMLAFSESEIAACNWIAAFGFDAVAAGRGLIALSNIDYRNRTDRADFSSKIEEALRFKARGGSARREIIEQIAARLKTGYDLKGWRWSGPRRLHALAMTGKSEVLIGDFLKSAQAATIARVNRGRARAAMIGLKVTVGPRDLLQFWMNVANRIERTTLRALVCCR
jgi:hypothetical protein